MELSVLLSYCLLATLLYRFLKPIYNLYFHPLSSFPGPRLAAATHLYEFYYSVILDGQFTWELERLHKQYGMGRFIQDV